MSYHFTEIVRSFLRISLPACFLCWAVPASRFIIIFESAHFRRVWETELLLFSQRDWIGTSVTSFYCHTSCIISCQNRWYCCFYDPAAVSKSSLIFSLLGNVDYNWMLLWRRDWIGTSVTSFYYHSSCIISCQNRWYCCFYDPAAVSKSAWYTIRHETKKILASTSD